MRKVIIIPGVKDVVFVQDTNSHIHLYSPGGFGRETWCGSLMLVKTTMYIGRKHHVAEIEMCETCWKLAQNNTNLLLVNVCQTCNAALFFMGCSACGGVGELSDQHPCPDCHPDIPCARSRFRLSSRHRGVIDVLY